MRWYQIQNRFNNLFRPYERSIHIWLTKYSSAHLLDKPSLLYINIFIIHKYTVHRNWNVVVKLLTLHFLDTCNSSKSRNQLRHIIYKMRCCFIDTCNSKEMPISIFLPCTWHNESGPTWVVKKTPKYNDNESLKPDCHCHVN